MMSAGTSSNALLDLSQEARSDGEHQAARHLTVLQALMCLGSLCQRQFLDEQRQLAAGDQR